MAERREVDERAFRSFVAEVEPRLRQALVALRGLDDGRDATAEALAWAWENWDRVQEMENPAGYLYRVGSSRSRPKPSGLLPRAHPAAGEFEPGLEPALDALSEQQRRVVVLVHGCEWSLQEVAVALDLSKSTVATHLERAMDRLRSALGVHDA